MVAPSSYRLYGKQVPEKLAARDYIKYVRRLVDHSDTIAKNIRLC